MVSLFDPSTESIRKGKPSKPAEPWADLPKLVAFAKHDNVVVKISGAGTLSSEPPTS